MERKEKSSVPVITNEEKGEKMIRGDTKRSREPEVGPGCFQGRRQLNTVVQYLSNDDIVRHVSEELMGPMKRPGLMVERGVGWGFSTLRKPSDKPPYTTA